MTQRIRLYFIHMPGCGACQQAKPHLTRWKNEYEKARLADPRMPAIEVVPIDLTTAKWTHPWQPDLTPTYVLEVPGKRRVQHQGVLTKAEIPKFIEKASGLMGGA